jgi:AcrR family transcriptional regulator
MSKSSTVDIPRRRSRDRRRAILRAAERLFAEHSYARTSMKRLARAVGVTDAALYNHFRSKREILEALYEERGFYHAIDTLEHLTGGRPLERQLVLTALASADLWAQNSDFLRIVFSEVLAGDRSARELHRGIMDRWHAGMRRLLSLYAEQGALNPEDVEPASEALVRLLLGTMVEKLLAEPAGNGALPFSQPQFRQDLGEAVAAFSRSLGAATPQPDGAGHQGDVSNRLDEEDVGRS